MQTGIRPDADGAKLLREATHVRIVLDTHLCRGTTHVGPHGIRVLLI
ncbi:MAG: hypothetical protein JWL65_2840 [Gammaproteobacteria bacterium]|nr:hypothetical protein [Gammaproteobacteria bacterium]